MLTSGEGVLRSVGFGFSLLYEETGLSPPLAAGAWSSRRAPRDGGLEQRNGLCVSRESLSLTLTSLVSVARGQG